MYVVPGPLCWGASSAALRAQPPQNRLSPPLGKGNALPAANVVVRRVNKVFFLLSGAAAVRSGPSQVDLKTGVPILARVVRGCQHPLTGLCLTA